MRNKVKAILLAVATLLGVIGLDVAAPDVAGAQSYPGPVTPCLGGSNGWYAVWNGSLNCSQQLYYNGPGGTGAAVTAHTVVDLHGPYSNGSACDYNPNCIRGVLECWTDLQDMYNPPRLGTIDEYGTSGLAWGGANGSGASIYEPFAWSKGLAPSSYYYHDSSYNDKRSIIPNLTGVNQAFVAKKATVSVYTPDQITWGSAQAADCTFRYKGVIPGGRYFQAAMNGQSNVPWDQYNYSRLGLTVWTHCVFC